MTSNTNNHYQERHVKRDYKDGNTSDDSLLLMADDGDDRAPLINGVGNPEAATGTLISSQSLSPSTHCHVPNDKFDYGARNRLIIVLIICIIFMVIEILGMLGKLKISWKNIMSRIYMFT